MPKVKFLLAAVLLAAVPGLARAEADDPDPALAAEMRQRGLVLYFRHTQTARDYADQGDATLADCTTQRNLGAVGRAQAEELGEHFRRLRIPVGEVLTSQFCRAKDTAQLAFGREEPCEALNLPRGEDYTPAQLATMRDGLLPLITTPVTAGSNRVIVAHDDNPSAAGGPELPRQGYMVALRPDGRGGFAVVGQLTPEAWSAMPE